MRIRPVHCFPFLLAAVLSVADIQAQTTFHVENGSFTISGRSNQSDWDVTAAVVEGSLVLADSGDPASVTSLEMTVPSGEIKASRGMIMQRVMNESLLPEDYPSITFRLDSVEVPDAPAEGTNLVANGKMTILETTNDVSIALMASVDADGNPSYSGSFPLTMTDYGMKTPTAMFGQLRVHRDISVAFELLFTE